MITVNEFYMRLGGGYEDVFYRLQNEERIKKFLTMLPKDTSWANLCAALDKKDYEAAFWAAHTLTGIALNLGLNRLTGATSEITEALRNRQENAELPQLLQTVEQRYQEVLEALNELVEQPAQSAEQAAQTQ